jgi:hypothetical protein
MSAIEAMKKRSSVRTYDERTIENEVYDKIEAYLNEPGNLAGPFGHSTKFLLLKQKGGEETLKVGTYGIIKGAGAYLTAIAENANDAIVDCGYAMEKFILFATGLGLGTCWLGGTYDKSSLLHKISVPEGSIIPAVTPLGYGKGKRRVFESMMRSFVSAADRKPWKELFLGGDFSAPLAENGAGELNTALEMVRIGPSASNKQPWRLVTDGRTCHFYLAHTPGYVGNTLGYDMQRLDIGIAMCHFDLVCREAGMTGEWTREDPKLTDKKEPVYIASYKL